MVRHVVMNKAAIALVALSVFLGGCASPARMDKMIADSRLADDYADWETALRQNVSVGSVLGGEGTNPLWTSEIGNTEFREALVLSLRNAGLLKRAGTADYELSAMLMEVEQPLFGLNLRVITKVKYRLVEQVSRTVLLEEEIVAPYTATFKDSALAVERLKLANEGSARSNIEALISRLYRLQIPQNKVSLLLH